METIDFRSDTVSWPTPAMRQAMATARVGDDVYGEDPTVNQLEALAAEMLGKEAALFVTSGTQGNITAVLTLCQRGEEMILGEDSHIFSWEAGSYAALGGVVPRPLPTDARGRLDPLQIAASVREDDPHLPRTTLLCIENSSGGNHGAALDESYFHSMRQVALTHGLRLHLDGARLFNATTALGVAPQALARHVDSISICLSKGLCAPVGSVLVGSQEFIDQARRIRKALGGGMRQAGVLAAAGLLALTEMTQRLAEDHAHARLLAEELANIPGILIEPDRVETNMVFFGLADGVRTTPEAVNARLKAEYNILLGGYGTRGFRAVTHYWITSEHVRQLAAAFAQILQGERQPVSS